MLLGSLLKILIPEYKTPFCKQVRLRAGRYRQICIGTSSIEVFDPRRSSSCAMQWCILRSSFVYGTGASSFWMENFSTRRFHAYYQIQFKHSIQHSLKWHTSLHGTRTSSFWLENFNTTCFYAYHIQYK